MHLEENDARGAEDVGVHSQFSCPSFFVRCCRGWLVFEAHRLLYHSTLGLRVIKKKGSLGFKVQILEMKTKSWRTQPVFLPLQPPPALGVGISGVRFRYA